MGWTGYHRTPGESDRDHLARELCTFADGRVGWTILDSTTVKGTFYAAVRVEEAGAGFSPAGTVFGLVVLQQRRRGYENYYRKEIEESSGPGDFDCPDRILDLLSPTESQWALEWRAACRTRNAVKRSRPKIRKGDLIRFARPLTFTSGATFDTFRFVERSTFSADGRLFRIPSWRDRDYEVAS